MMAHAALISLGLMELKGFLAHGWKCKYLLSVRGTNHQLTGDTQLSSQRVTTEEWCEREICTMMLPLQIRDQLVDLTIKFF